MANESVPQPDPINEHNRKVLDGMSAERNRYRVKVKYQKPNKWNTKYPFARLPYWKRENRASFPSVDGYATGCEMGKAAALAYLKTLRATDGTHGGNLQCFVLDLMAQNLDVSCSAEEGHRGIVVGFFAELDRWAHASARILGIHLDVITESEIELRMSRAASETDEDCSNRLCAERDARAAA